MFVSTWKSTIRHLLPPLEVPVWHIFFQKKTFSSGLMFYAFCFMFYDYQWCANFRIYVRNLLTLQKFNNILL